MSFPRRSCEGDLDGNGVEDDDFDDDIAEEGGVQLGVIAPIEGPPDKILFKNIDWHGWDGGKAGGWPVSCFRTHLRSVPLCEATWRHRNHSIPLN